MQPHVNLGIRFRTMFKISQGGGGDKGLKKGTPMSILALVSAMEGMFKKVPFWRRIYRQGRRG